MRGENRRALRAFPQPNLTTVVLVDTLLGCKGDRRSHIDWGVVLYLYPLLSRCQQHWFSHLHVYKNDKLIADWLMNCIFANLDVPKAFSGHVVRQLDTRCIVAIYYCWWRKQSWGDFEIIAYIFHTKEKLCALVCSHNVSFSRWMGCKGLTFGYPMDRTVAPDNKTRDGKCCKQIKLWLRVMLLWWNTLVLWTPICVC